MYSQKEKLKKLKKTYKEQEIPRGLQEEIRQRFLIEEQSFIKARRRKRRLQGFVVSLVIVMITTSSLLFNSQVRSFAEDLPILGSVIELILGERFTDQSEKIDIQVPKIHTFTKDKQILKKLKKNMEILKRIITKFWVIIRKS